MMQDVLDVALLVADALDATGSGYFVVERRQEASRGQAADDARRRRGLHPLSPREGAG
jgi:hypothetical protein